MAQWCSLLVPGIWRRRKKKEPWSLEASNIGNTVRLQCQNEKSWWEPRTIAAPKLASTKLPEASVRRQANTSPPGLRKPQWLCHSVSSHVPHQGLRSRPAQLCPFLIFKSSSLWTSLTLPFCCSLNNKHSLFSRSLNM